MRLVSNKDTGDAAALMPPAWADDDEQSATNTSSGNSDDVILTMVEGEILYYKGEYSTLNLAEIIAKNNELYKTVFE